LFGGWLGALEVVLGAEGGLDDDEVAAFRFRGELEDCLAAGAVSCDVPEQLLFDIVDFPL
jgi:hypothetical protein